MGRALAGAGEEQGRESCSPTQSCPEALGEASLVELTPPKNKRELFSDLKETHSTLLPMGFPVG